MKISYEDRIFNVTGEWIHGNAIVVKVKGDKTAIIRTLHNLTDMKYLETKKEGKMIFYRRKDMIESDESFQFTHTNVTQKNNIYFLEGFKNISELSTKKNKLSPSAKKILQHLEWILDRNMILITRTSYQMNLGLISERIAQKRIKMVEDERDGFMKKITTKYNNDLKLMQEYFQNHNKELKFKI